MFGKTKKTCLETMINSWEMIFNFVNRSWAGDAVDKSVAVFAVERFQSQLDRARVQMGHFKFSCRFCTRNVVEVV